LGADVDKLDIVQSLRKQSFNLHSDTALTGTGVAEKSKVKSWVEVDFDFVKGEEAEGRTGILSALSGTRGFGVQRAFWNAETKEMVAVVWIGGGLAGWPGVAHGGAIATIFEETMARMVRGPNGAVGMYTIQPRHHAIEPALYDLVNVKLTVFPQSPFTVQLR
jgi:acyl-coenzyme A thioesterase PaaI-like protein